MAVTEGFEPSVGCPTPAFEAGSIGHSDTSPQRSLSESCVARPCPTEYVMLHTATEPVLREVAVRSTGSVAVSV